MNIVDVKARARRLKTFAKSKLNMELTHAQALEATAFMDIGKDWNTYSSQLVEPAPESAPELSLVRGRIGFVPLSEILNTYAIPEAVDGLLAYCNKMSLADYMAAKNKPRPPFESFHSQCWEVTNFLEGLRLTNPDGELSFTSSRTYSHPNSPKGRILTAQLNQRASEECNQCGMRGFYQLLRDLVGPTMPNQDSLTDKQLLVVQLSNEVLATTAPLSTISTGNFICVGHTGIDPATLFLDEPALLQNTLILGNGLALNVQKFLQSILGLHRKRTVWIDLGSNRRNSKLDQPMDTYDTLAEFIDAATKTPQTRPAYIHASASREGVLDELRQWFEHRLTVPKAVRFVIVTASSKIEPALLLNLLKMARKANIALILQEHHEAAWTRTISSSVVEDWVPAAIDLIGNYVLVEEQKHAYSVMEGDKSDENRLSARILKAMGFDLAMLAAGVASNQYWLVTDKKCHVLTV